LSDVGPIQTRIIERLADGNYKIKGQQPFMIGKRDYKVLVVGIVRPEDYNDEGISSGKLIDPQFDVVSIRKKEAQQ
jgi:flagellar L-ring protein precursor FlgH